LRAGHKVSEDELLAFARERLANYKLPERILFRDELPKGQPEKFYDATSDKRKTRWRP
jgi:acyl-CoA synthetase (AMP-forming)/AMP-acid ligase II